MTDNKHTCSSQYKMRELPDPECAACMAEVSKKPPLDPWDDYANIRHSMHRAGE